MTDIITSQNIDLSSLIILYMMIAFNVIIDEDTFVRKPLNG
jgi:hypothetical protein